MNTAINVTWNLCLTTLSGLAVAKMINLNPKLTAAIMLASTIVRMTANYFIEKKYPCCTPISRPKGHAINSKEAKEAIERQIVLHLMTGAFGTGGLLGVMSQPNLGINAWLALGILAYTGGMDALICKLSGRLTHIVCGE